MHTYHRSGTKVEYTELCQLLEDISCYLRDVAVHHRDQKREKKRKEQEDKLQGEWLRKLAMEGINSKHVVVLF